MKAAPDPIHVDWLTVCGTTIPELVSMPYSLVLDYQRNIRPHIHFKQVVEYQDKHQPYVKNEFVVATLLDPPDIDIANNPCESKYIIHFPENLFKLFSFLK